MKLKFFVIVIVIFCAKILFAQNESSEQINTKILKEVLTGVKETLINYYVFPDKSLLFTEYLDQQDEKGKYNTLTNPNDFASEITKDILSKYNDKHLRIIYDPVLEKEIIKFNSSEKSAVSITEKDITRDEKNNFYFKKIEILPSNIGYIEFTGFANPSPSGRKTISAVMKVVSHTDALILDLRNNYGGNGVMANEILSYFFNEKTYIGKNFNKIENKWTDLYTENLKEVTEGIVLNMPIYILISKRTFSAAEGLAYSLQNLRNAIVIGDTSRGGAHLTRSFSLGNGFVGFIPYLRGENVKTNTDWEGIGVIPDILEKEGNSLLAAQNSILSAKLSQAVDDVEKKKIQWLINYNESLNSILEIDPLEAVKFSGQYSEFEITFDGKNLLFRDVSQKNNDFKKLTPINTLLYQIGKDYQIEFVKDDNSFYNAIKMYWDDGWSETIPRTK